jgi:hypothetical protein
MRERDAGRGGVATTDSPYQCSLRWGLLISLQLQRDEQQSVCVLCALQFFRHGTPLAFYFFRRTTHPQALLIAVQ